MANNRQIRELLDATAYDVNGDKLGSVNEVYINDLSGQPDFIDINHGLFGMSSSLVPLRGHQLTEEGLQLAFEKDRIKDAPNIDAEAHLSKENQAELYAHYGLQAVEDHTNYLTENREAAAVTPTAAPAATTADNELIRSEERLNVDKQREATGKATLRKYVVHDTETVEVPVTREEVRLERTPIDADEAAALGNPSIGEGEASVTLHEERAAVTKESVPVEKVNLAKDTIRETETIAEEVAKERIEVDGVDPRN